MDLKDIINKSIIGIGALVMFGSMSFFLATNFYTIDEHKIKQEKCCQYRIKENEENKGDHYIPFYIPMVVSLSGATLLMTGVALQTYKK